MKNYNFKIIVYWLLWLVFFNNNSWANDSKILIIGDERIDRETILSYLDIEGLNNNSSKSIQDSTKNLVQSDLFSDVKINFEKNKIVVAVKENPIISEIKFVGNKKIEEEMLVAELSIKKRGIFSQLKLQNDLKRLNEIYIKSGRFLAFIEPKIIFKDQNRAEVIFEINEGKKTKIGKIYFVGNKAFIDDQLQEAISTKQSKWWKFLSSSDNYDSDRIEYDKELLRKFYGERGYADFSVISSVAQIKPSKDSFFISFLVEEGIKYKVGKVEIVNNIPKFDSDILKKSILIKEGQTYNSDLIQKTVDNMIELMAEKSYAFADIEPILRRDTDNKIINIDFTIHETAKFYINQIKISGNTHTIDEVIRRELRLREGDPFNIARVNRSRQRIQNLGFFEKVEINTKRVGNSDKIDLEIEVKEKKTGDLNAGVGYSTIDRFSINAGIREINLFGTGRKFSINVQKSFARLSSSLSYTKPYFLGYPLEAGFDVFKEAQAKRNSLAYDQDSKGFNLLAGYSIGEYTTHSLRYIFSDQTIENVNPNASYTIRNLQGNFLTSGVGHSISYDKRDNFIDPKNGYYISLDQEYNGIGGDIKTIKNEGRAGYYLPILSSNDFILKFSLRGGVIKGIGQAVRSNNAYFLGGNNFRGFEFAGLGPRTRNAENQAIGGDIVGGRIFYVNTVELRFPLGLPRELGIYGVLFSDTGLVKGVDKRMIKNQDVIDSGSLRSSYGVSIVWSSPMGPIRLDFSKILKKEVYDIDQKFRFNIGTSF